MATPVSSPKAKSKSSTTATTSSSKKATPTAAATQRLSTTGLSFRATPPIRMETDEEDKIAQDVLRENQKLLQAIADNDFMKYTFLCSKDMTCFEPESNNQLVQGKAFHKFYFDMGEAMNNNNNINNSSNHSIVKTNITMVQPHVRILSPTAVVISYVRLTQSVSLTDGSANNSNNNYNEMGGKQPVPITKQVSETRVWEQKDGIWRNCHVHKSC